MKISNEIRKLADLVSFEGGFHIIYHTLFDFVVWDSKKQEAEEAFEFAFQAIYKIFALEDDNNLSPSAQKLKQSMLAYC